MILDDPSVRPSAHMKEKRQLDFQNTSNKELELLTEVLK